MKLRTICATLIFLSVNAVYAKNILLETFEDGSISDGSPLLWQVFPGFNSGSTNVVDGDLVVSQSGGHSFIPFATTPAPADVSLRTVLRTEDYMSVIARGDTTTGTSYGAGIRSNGVVHIMRTHPATGPGVSTFLATEQTDLSPANEDVYLQFDLIGPALNLYAWRVGEAKPALPNVSVVDNTHSNSGPVGFIKCCGAETSTIQFLQIADAPIGDLTGDFDANGVHDGEDIDLLSGSLGSHDALFDLSLDGNVDEFDRDAWFQIAGFTVGDIDFDGDVDTADSVFLTQNWTGAMMASDGTLSYTAGDVDGDGDVDTADQTALVSNWTGAMMATNTPSVVPEPKSLTLMLLIGLAVAESRRRLSIRPLHSPPMRTSHS